MGAVKTSDPHPQSYLAFGCRILEAHESFERALPASLTPSQVAARLQSSESKLKAAALEDHGLRFAAWDELHNQVVDRTLDEVGLSREQRSSDAVAAVSFWMKRGLRLTHPISQNSDDLRPESEDLKTWRPLRRSVCRVILGVHLNFGSKSKHPAANALSRGVPSDASKKERFTAFNVRDALKPMEALMLREFFKAPAGYRDIGLAPTAFALINEAEATEELWRIYLQRRDLAKLRSATAAADVLVLEGVTAQVFSRDRQPPSDSLWRTTGELVKLAQRAIDGRLQPAA